MLKFKKNVCTQPVETVILKSCPTLSVMISNKRAKEEVASSMNLMFVYIIFTQMRRIDYKNIP